MVDGQIRPSDVTKYPIIDAMLKIPREEFVPAGKRSAAYLGDHISVKPGRVILDPRTLAKMLDCLNIRPNELVLDIGSMLGYSTAIVARMAEVVVALEEIEGMTEEAEQLLVRESVDNAVTVQGKLIDGAPQHGPYDAIVIQGGIEQLPGSISGQLKDGGRIGALFIQGVTGEFRIGFKHGEILNWHSEFNATAPVLPGFNAETGFVF